MLSFLSPVSCPFCRLFQKNPWGYLGQLCVTSNPSIAIWQLFSHHLRLQCQHAYYSPDHDGCGLLWCHCTYKKHLDSAPSSNATNHLSTLQIWKGPNPLKSRWSINSLYFLLMCVCWVSLSDFCAVSLNWFQLNEAAKRFTIGDSSSNSSRTNSPGGVWLNEVSCMGTESVGRGITTVCFEHVSHQSCQRAVEQWSRWWLHAAFEGCVKSSPCWIDRSVRARIHS